MAHQQVTPIIVDTDMALDDARALAILLEAPELDVKAIVTSDGSAPARAGATNVVRILHFLGRDKIPVGAGHELNKPPPVWVELSTTLGWSELPLPPNVTIADAGTLIPQIFDRSTNRIVWVCLGPLSNLAELLDSRPELTNRISRVFYSGNHPDAPDPGWNTMRDIRAARAVFGAGVEIVAVHLPAERALLFDTDLYGEISRLDTSAARLIARLHAHPNVQRLLAANHFRAWDETVALALLEPSAMSLERSPRHSNVVVVTGLDTARARAAYIHELAHAAADVAARPPALLNQFPTTAELFQPDVQPFVAEIIARHGAEEWVAGVLTSELHRHLGIYSILGAKMGLRAREVFGAGLDELRVESFAGLKPPLSCLNDGLQVATGASLGRGTIRVVSASSPEPAAVFIHGARKLHMRLRPEVLSRIQATLKALAEAHGEATPANFAALRRYALEAWRDLDRKTIFIETFETNAAPAAPVQH
ncbi:MAG: nucleoside hydrolase [Verrucomicrobiae bacterium]|nr:nucleoside hydrolase [Verrucomicrobiae bacterium]